MVERPKPSSPPEGRADSIVIKTDELEQETYSKEAEMTNKQDSPRLIMTDSGMPPMNLIRWGFIALFVSFAMFAFMSIQLDEPELQNFESDSDYTDALISYEDDKRVNQALHDFVFFGSAILIVAGMLLMALNGENENPTSIRIVLIVGSLYMLAALYGGVAMPFATSDTQGILNLVG